MLLSQMLLQKRLELGNDGVHCLFSIDYILKHAAGNFVSLLIITDAIIVSREDRARSSEEKRLGQMLVSFPQVLPNDDAYAKFESKNK